MNFDSYIISETKTAITVLQNSPPPYSHKGFDKLSFKKKAFTLAEVLITLTIIGVVAAMTIPTLMSKYQKQSYETALKKAYSNLQNAWKMIPLNEGCPAGDYDCARINSSPILNNELFAKNFKTSQIYTSGNESCNTHPVIAKDANYPCFITQDGMTFTSYYYDTILVDINGPKGPNVPAYDIFAFIFDTNTKKLQPYGAPKFVKESPGKWEAYTVGPKTTEECKTRVTHRDWDTLECTYTALTEGIKY